MQTVEAGGVLRFIYSFGNEKYNLIIKRYFWDRE